MTQVTLTPEQIKAQLLSVESLVIRGEVAKADRAIRSLISKGATLADVQINLTTKSMKALNKFSKDNLAEDD